MASWLSDCIVVLRKTHLRREVLIRINIYIYFPAYISHELGT